MDMENVPEQVWREAEKRADVLRSLAAYECVNPWVIFGSVTDEREFNTRLFRQPSCTRKGSVRHVTFAFSARDCMIMFT